MAGASFSVTLAARSGTRFAGPLVTQAFRFWYNNPQINYGYCVEVVGNDGVGTEFWGSNQEDGQNAAVLSITFRIPQAGSIQDCNRNGVADHCDIAQGETEDENGNGIPDECEPTDRFRR